MSLELGKEDIRRGIRTRYKGSDGTNHRRYQRIEAARYSHQTRGDGSNHSRIVHHTRQGYQRTDGHHRLAQIHRGTGKNHHQFLEAQSLNQSTNRSTQEEHQSCIGNPAKLKGAVEHRQMNRTHQMTLEESIDRRTECTGNQDEYQYKEVNAPCLQALGKRKGFLILHLALSGKHLGVCDDGNNGSQRTDDGWSFRTEIIAADKLHYHGNHSHPEGDDEILDKIVLIGKCQDDERQDDKERCQLDNGECRSLANLCRRSRSAFRHLIAERSNRHAHSTKSRSHGITNQGYQSREHRFESESDEDGSRYRHRRSEARHTFEQSAESPYEEQHEQSLIIGNRCKLPLDYLYLLAFHEDIIAVDSHQDDDENREYRFQDAFHHRPSRQGDHAIFRMFRGNHA